MGCRAVSRCSTASRPTPTRSTADDAPARLQRLQYSLHVASEEAYGLDPPADAEPAHDELTWALGGARDATAEVAEALDEQGLDGVAPLLHEWRGALFRVRLARLRLAAPKPAPAAGAAPRSLTRRSSPGRWSRSCSPSPARSRSRSVPCSRSGRSGPPGSSPRRRRSSRTGPSRTRLRPRAAAACARARAARCSRTGPARPSSR